MRLAGIEVVAVEDKQALKEFVELPYTLYRDDPYWVPPLRIAVKELLDRKKHPFYANAEAEFFLARQDGRVVGRIAAIVDRSSQPVSRRECRVFRLLRMRSTTRRGATRCCERARAMGAAIAARSSCAVR